jgi:hypothetical protein
MHAFLTQVAPAGLWQSGGLLHPPRQGVHVPAPSQLPMLQLVPMFRAV